MTFYVTYRQFTEGKAPKIYTKKVRHNELMNYLHNIITYPELFELISVVPAK